MPLTYNGEATPRVAGAGARVLLDTAAIVIAAAIVPAAAFGFVYSYTVDVPFWDDWDYAPIIVAARSGHILWAAAWGQHNEHRTFVMAMLMAALSRFGGWSELRETLFGVGLVTLNLAVLWRTISRSVPLAPYVFLATSLLTFSLAQNEVLCWGMGIGWFVANGCALLVCYRLSRATVDGGDVAAALVASAVSSYTLAAGLVCLPVGLIALLARERRDRSLVAAWMLGGAAIVMLYFYGFQRSASSPLHGIDFVTIFPEYVLAFLGAPLGGWQGLQLSVTLGAIAIVLFALATVRFTVKRRSGEDATAYVPWLALGTFAIVNAAITAYGRAATGAGQALSSRYTTIGSDFWIAAIPLTALVISEAFQRGIARRAFMVASAIGASCFVALFVATQISGLAASTFHAERVGEGLAALHDSPNPSDGELKLLYPEPNYVRTRLAQLRASGDRAVGSYLWAAR